MKNVKITKGDYEGQILKGHRYYYDYLHTGNSPDLFSIQTPNGDKTITSDFVDIEHYEQQCLQEELTRLSATVGDLVVIIRAGSGSYIHGWNNNIPPTITNITSRGYVEVDDGAARMFRPDVKIVNL